ncbi:hypothetical protein MTYP_02526 [Methylophilaceae bacterium]|nr:hypothetical protein MTYP_02526 [Methylophilaceae bacterium]
MHAENDAGAGILSQKNNILLVVWNVGGRMQTTVFGLTEAQVTEFGMTFGVGGLMLMMLLIVAHLAWQSKAGKFGTFVLFLGLTLGLVGFTAKYLIQYTLGIE